MIVGELGLNLSDVIILTIGLGALVKVIADYRGWTRSPALVRQENADLRERNATLQAEVERLDKADRQKAQQIAALEARVEELQKRDQAAVLDAISAHEQMAASSFEAIRAMQHTHEQASSTRHSENAKHHDESLAVWREIRDALKGDQP